MLPCYQLLCHSLIVFFFLKDLMKTRDQLLRKAEQENDSLTFRNQQLTKRLTLLQEDLDEIQVCNVYFLCFCDLPVMLLIWVSDFIAKYMYKNFVFVFSDKGQERKRQGWVSFGRSCCWHRCIHRRTSCGYLCYASHCFLFNLPFLYLLYVLNLMTYLPCIVCFSEIKPFLCWVV